MRNKKILAVVLVCALAIGCAAAGVIAKIEQYEPAIAKAFGIVVSILQQDGVITLGASTTLTADIAKGTADFADLTSDITAAKTASGAATGSINKTIAVLGSLQNDLGQLQTDIPGGVPANDVQDVKLTLQAVVVVLATFQAQLTPVAALPVNQQRKALAKLTVPDITVFKASVNLIQVTHGHPDKQI